MVGARRYRLSRTSWRGIRFSFRGHVWALIKIFILGSFLTGLTLGLYYPFFLVSRQAFMVVALLLRQRAVRLQRARA